VIKDPIYGDTITITQVARHLTSTKSPGDEYIALYVTITEGTKYTGGASIDSLTIDEIGGTEKDGETIDSDTAVLTAAGLKPVISTDDPTAGSTIKGWAIFHIFTAPGAKLAIGFTRNAAKIIGGSSDQTIPAMTTSVPLPA
jgi:hypothetical protein